MGKVTIKDVAKQAGVSITTVSKVINGKGNLSKETRDHVMKVVKELQYSVNANARSLKAAKTNKIGVIVSDISNLFLMSIAKSVENVIRSIDYHMVLMSHNDDRDTERELLHLMLEQQVDALFLFPTGGNADLIENILSRKIPIIAVDREVDGVETDYIADDHYYGSFESIAHLHSLGHEKIAFLYGHRKNSIGRERYDGAIDAFKQFNIPIEEAYIKCANFSEHEAFRATTELLLLPTPPTAIYSSNNTMTVGVLKAIEEQGLRYPDDISVIAFAEPSQWELLKPSLTLMTQALQRIGVEAAIMLKNRLTMEEDYPPKRVIIKPKLQIKDSTAPPKAT
ncbi:LacI family DNA-binding transcriptional regulator [Alkalihalobacillus sp. BA299]|uniref:LacI family DNA-binding transcriptional regulator n=1 Tax=Alkalihalobacillus sp. BA299 TaxID=2815938 RepID=UPI001ADA3FB8|nr:LacI family DNA-binding transcriptional regulator [Alkalihalobacillus sp. BA299]